MKVKEIEIEKLIPYENNPRHNDNAVEAVANSIREFGFQQPIVVDKNMVVVAGHTRLKGAQTLGLKTVPIVVADGLTDEQIRAYRLADNKVGELATWDTKTLEIELGAIEGIDMEDFGFELPDLDDTDDGYYGDAREATANHYNMDYIDESRLDGKWGMPIIMPTQHIPQDLISFNYVLSTNEFDKGVHFYIDDYQFERIWTRPEFYIKKLMEYDCVLTPDFSLYTEMPLAMQVWNVYRSRLIGQMMQDRGIKVIPTLSWCRPDSYEFCFDGLSKGGVVSVSTIGVKRQESANDLWFMGMDEAMKRLEPSAVVVYGGDIGYDFGNTKVIYISNHNADRLKEGSK